MVCSLHSVTTGSRDRANVALTIVVLTGFLPSSAVASIYSLIAAIRHRVSPEFIGSRNCVLMAVTAESPPARGQ